MSTAVVDILKADAPVIARAKAIKKGFRIDSRGAPNQTWLPFVRDRIEGTEYNDTKDGGSTLDIETHSVRSYAVDDEQAEALAALVKTALDKYSGTINGNVVKSSQLIDSNDDEEDVNGTIIPFVDQTYRILINTS